MGVTTRDIFGEGAGPQPATPGSYGDPPKGARLPERTSLGRVVLRVADLARSVAFYEQVLGMRVIAGVAEAEAASGRRALLGPQGVDRVLVELREHPGASAVPRRGRVGLFHFAILLPDRPSLGRFVSHLGERGVQAGAGDHLVSEAFYLSDPDGLGIEVYADRPRESWRRVGRELMMATDPVDVAGLVSAGGSEPWRGMPGGTVMGHLHLHVGDIAGAAAFYSETLGFDRTGSRYPGALFLGAGGYHHHLGTNTWAGTGARAPSENEAQLVEWTIELPRVDDVRAVAQRLEAAGATVEHSSDGQAIRTRDPWGTAVRLRTPAERPA